MRDNMTIVIIGGFFLGYIFGSIPSGFWLVKAVNGIDIRFYGNTVGTSAVYRIAGSKTAFAVWMAAHLVAVLTGWLLQYPLLYHINQVFFDMMLRSSKWTYRALG